MDPRSHHKIAESLWGLYMSVTHNNKECIQKERNENDINSNPNNSPDNIYAGNSCNSNSNGNSNKNSFVDQSTANIYERPILSTIRKFLLVAHPVAVNYFISNLTKNIHYHKVSTVEKEEEEMEEEKEFNGCNPRNVDDNSVLKLS